MNKMQTLPQVQDTGKMDMIVKRVSVPIGLEELMEGLCKEVLLKKPKDLYIFASEYFSKLVNLREKDNKYKTRPHTLQSAASIKNLNSQASKKIPPARPIKHLSRQLSISNKSPDTANSARTKVLEKRINASKSRERSSNADRKDTASKVISKTTTPRDLSKTSNRNSGTSTGTSSLQSTPREKRQSSVPKKEKYENEGKKVQRTQRKNKSHKVKTALISPTVIGGSTAAANIAAKPLTEIIKDKKNSHVMDSDILATSTNISVMNPQGNIDKLTKSDTSQTKKENVDETKRDNESTPDKSVIKNTSSSNGDTFSDLSKNKSDLLGVATDTSKDNILQKEQQNSLIDINTNKVILYEENASSEKTEDLIPKIEDVEDKSNPISIDKLPEPSDNQNKVNGSKLDKEISSDGLIKRSKSDESKTQSLDLSGNNELPNAEKFKHIATDDTRMSFQHDDVSVEGHPKNDNNLGPTNSPIKTEKEIKNLEVTENVSKAGSDLPLADPPINQDFRKIDIPEVQGSIPKDNNQNEINDFNLLQNKNHKATEKTIDRTIDELKVLPDNVTDIGKTHLNENEQNTTTNLSLDERQDTISTSINEKPSAAKEENSFLQTDQNVNDRADSKVTSAQTEQLPTSENILPHSNFENNTFNIKMENMGKSDDVLTVSISDSTAEKNNLKENQDAFKSESSSVEKSKQEKIQFFREDEKLVSTENDQAKEILKNEVPKEKESIGSSVQFKKEHTNPIENMSDKPSKEVMLVSAQNGGANIDSEKAENSPLEITNLANKNKSFDSSTQIDIEQTNNVEKNSVKSPQKDLTFSSQNNDRETKLINEVTNVSSEKMETPSLKDTSLVTDIKSVDSSDSVEKEQAIMLDSMGVKSPVQDLTVSTQEFASSKQTESPSLEDTDAATDNKYVDSNAQVEQEETSHLLNMSVKRPKIDLTVSTQNNQQELKFENDTANASGDQTENPSFKDTSLATDNKFVDSTAQVRKEQTNDKENISYTSPKKDLKVSTQNHETEINFKNDVANASGEQTEKSSLEVTSLATTEKSVESNTQVGTEQTDHKEDLSVKSPEKDLTISTQNNEKAIKFKNDILNASGKQIENLILEDTSLVTDNQSVGNIAQVEKEQTDHKENLSIKSPEKDLGGSIQNEETKIKLRNEIAKISDQNMALPPSEITKLAETKSVDSSAQVERKQTDQKENLGVKSPEKDLTVLPQNDETEIKFKNEVANASGELTENPPLENTSFATDNQFVDSIAQDKKQQTDQKENLSAKSSGKDLTPKHETEMKLENEMSSRDMNLATNNTSVDSSIQVEKELTNHVGNMSVQSPDMTISPQNDELDIKLKHKVSYIGGEKLEYPPLEDTNPATDNKPVDSNAQVDKHKQINHIENMSVKCLEKDLTVLIENEETKTKLKNEIAEITSQNTEVLPSETTNLATETKSVDSSAPVKKEITNSIENSGVKLSEEDLTTLTQNKETELKDKVVADMSGKKTENLSLEDPILATDNKSIDSKALVKKQQSNPIHNISFQSPKEGLLQQQSESNSENNNKITDSDYTQNIINSKITSGQPGLIDTPIKSFLSSFINSEQLNVFKNDKSENKINEQNNSNTELNKNILNKEEKLTFNSVKDLLDFDSKSNKILKSNTVDENNETNQVGKKAKRSVDNDSYVDLKYVGVSNQPNSLEANDFKEKSNKQTIQENTNLNSQIENQLQKEENLTSSNISELRDFSNDGIKVVESSKFNVTEANTSERCSIDKEHLNKYENENMEDVIHLPDNRNNQDTDLENNKYEPKSKENDIAEQWQTEVNKAHKKVINLQGKNNIDKNKDEYSKVEENLMENNIKTADSNHSASTNQDQKNEVNQPISKFLNSFLTNEQTNVFKPVKEKYLVKTSDFIEIPNKTGVAKEIVKQISYNPNSNNSKQTREKVRSLSHENVLSNGKLPLSSSAKHTKNRRPSSVGVRPEENISKSKIPTSVRRSAGRRPLVRQLETDSRDLEEKMETEKKYGGEKDKSKKMNEKLKEISEKDKDKMDNDSGKDKVTKEDVFIAKTILKGIEGAEKHIELIDEKYPDKKEALSKHLTSSADVEETTNNYNKTHEEKIITKGNMALKDNETANQEETQISLNVNEVPESDEKKDLLELTSTAACDGKSTNEINNDVDNNNSESIGLLNEKENTKEEFKDGDSTLDKLNTITKEHINIMNETKPENKQQYKEAIDNSPNINNKSEDLVVPYENKNQPVDTNLEKVGGSETDQLNIAATKIQKTWKGYNTRTHYKNTYKNDDVSKSNEENLKSFIEPTGLHTDGLKSNDAAVKIQSIWRGFVTRKMLSNLSRKANNPKTDREKSIIKIQAVVRGYLDRLKCESLKKINMKNDNIAENVSSEINTTSPENKNDFETSRDTSMYDNKKEDTTKINDENRNTLVNGEIINKEVNEKRENTQYEKALAKIESSTDLVIENKEMLEDQRDGGVENHLNNFKSEIKDQQDIKDPTIKSHRTLENINTYDIISKTETNINSKSLLPNKVTASNIKDVTEDKVEDDEIKNSETTSNYISILDSSDMPNEETIKTAEGTNIKEAKGHIPEEIKPENVNETSDQGINNSQINEAIESQENLGLVSSDKKLQDETEVKDVESKDIDNSILNENVKTEETIDNDESNDKVPMDNIEASSKEKEMLKNKQEVKAMLTQENVTSNSEKNNNKVQEKSEDVSNFEILPPNIEHSELPNPLDQDKVVEQNVNVIENRKEDISKKTSFNLQDDAVSKDANIKLENITDTKELFTKDQDPQDISNSIKRETEGTEISETTILGDENNKEIIQNITDTKVHLQNERTDNEKELHDQQQASIEKLPMVQTVAKEQEQNDDEKQIGHNSILKNNFETSDSVEKLTENDIVGKNPNDKVVDDPNEIKNHGKNLSNYSLNEEQEESSNKTQNTDDTNQERNIKPKTNLINELNTKESINTFDDLQKDALINDSADHSNTDNQILTTLSDERQNVNLSNQKPDFYRSDTVIEPQAVKKDISQLGDEKVETESNIAKILHDNIHLPIKDNNNNSEDVEETEMEKEIRSAVKAILNNKTESLPLVESEIKEAVKNIMENNIGEKEAVDNKSTSTNEIVKPEENIILQKSTRDKGTSEESTHHLHNNSNTPLLVDVSALNKDDSTNIVKNNIKQNTINEADLATTVLPNKEDSKNLSNTETISDDVSSVDSMDSVITVVPNVKDSTTDKTNIITKEHIPVLNKTVSHGITKETAGTEITHQHLLKKSLSADALKEHVDLIDQVQNTILDQISGKPAETGSKFDIDLLRKELEEAASLYKSEDDVSLATHDDELLEYLNDFQPEDSAAYDSKIIKTPIRELTDIEEESDSKDDDVEPEPRPENKSTFCGTSVNMSPGITKIIDNKPLEEHIDTFNLDNLKNGHNEIVINNDKIQINGKESNMSDKKMATESINKLLHTSELHDSVVIPISSISIDKSPEQLQHTSEFHDTLVVPLPSGSDVKIKNEAASASEVSSVEAKRAESVDSGNQTAYQQAPAGDAIVTSRRRSSQESQAAGPQSAGVEAQAPLRDTTSPTKPTSAGLFTHQSTPTSHFVEQDMESENNNNNKRNNAISNVAAGSAKNMEVEAATKIQAGFRGYQVRKQLKTKNADKPSQEKQPRRKSSGRKSLKDVDLAEKSAVKIQAGVRGFLVRRRQKKQINSSASA